jgi:predicted secreted protein
MAEIEVGEGHNGATISAKVGDYIVIRLPENRTTGFHWSGEHASLNVLELQSDEFTQAASGTIGGSGVRILRFSARSAGHVSVALQLARPWEANAPRSQFRIEVTVSQ